MNDSPPFCCWVVFAWGGVRMQYLYLISFHLMERCSAHYSRRQKRAQKKWGRLYENGSMMVNDKPGLDKKNFRKHMLVGPIRHYYYKSLPVTVSHNSPSIHAGEGAIKTPDMLLLQKTTCPTDRLWLWKRGIYICIYTYLEIYIYNYIYINTNT